MLTCSMMRFLSLLLLGICPCVVSVIVLGLSVRLFRGTLCGCGGCCDCDACTVVCVAWCMLRESVGARLAAMLVWGGGVDEVWLW